MLLSISAVSWIHTNNHGNSICGQKMSLTVKTSQICRCLYYCGSLCGFMGNARNLINWNRHSRKTHWGSHGRAEWQIWAASESEKHRERERERGEEEEGDGHSFICPQVLLENICFNIISYLLAGWWEGVINSVFSIQINSCGWLNSGCFPLSQASAWPLDLKVWEIFFFFAQGAAEEEEDKMFRCFTPVLVDEMGKKWKGDVNTPRCVCSCLWGGVES